MPRLPRHLAPLALLPLLVGGTGCSFDLSASWPDAKHTDGPHDLDMAARPDAPADAGPDSDSAPPGKTPWHVTCGVDKKSTDGGPPQGHLHVTGGFRGAVTFGVEKVAVTAQGLEDLFVWKLPPP